jgi:hypothetical protein
MVQVLSEPDDAVRIDTFDVCQHQRMGNTFRDGRRRACFVQKLAGQIIESWNCDTWQDGSSHEILLSAPCLDLRRHLDARDPSRRMDRL